MLLKEDGHLDIESISKLSDQDRIDEMKSWSKKQEIEYLLSKSTWTDADEFEVELNNERE